MANRKQHLFNQESGEVITIYEHSVQCIVDYEDKIIIALLGIEFECLIPSEKQELRQQVRNFQGGQFPAIQITKM